TKHTANQVKYHGGFGETALPSIGRYGSLSRPSIPPPAASEWYDIQRERLRSLAVSMQLDTR
ncbi:MAG: hypothetical protein WCH43_13500, partial [Verrucomicrobiota bacterium]